MSHNRNNKKDYKNNNEDFYSKMKNCVLKNGCEDYKKFILVHTEEFISKKLNRMTKTQMRNIFDLVMSCRNSEELNMIKPRLIYTAGRLEGESKKFLINLSKLVTKANNDEDVENMKKFLETALAYHKYYAKS